MAEETRELTCVMRGRGPCDGPQDLHHIIPKQRLRNELGRQTPEAEGAVSDARNLVILCRRHHELVTTRALKLRRTEVTSAVYEFALEHGLEWSLDKDLEDA